MNNFQGRWCLASFYKQQKLSTFQIKFNQITGRKQHGKTSFAMQANGFPFGSLESTDSFKFFNQDP